MNIISGLRFFYLRKISPGFKIGKDALVIDIGSGDKPFWRADVYVDRLSLGNVQRTSEFKTIHDMGFFVDSDVESLPFKSKSFDFSFSSHLLEHVENPGRVIKEITRVSKSGYLEVPNGILETIKPFDSHLWFVFKNKKKLIFVRKGKRLHEVLLNNGVKYDSLLNKIHEPFIRIYWNKTIEFEIINDYKSEEEFRSKIGDNKREKINLLNPYLLLIKLIRLLFYKSKNLKDIKTTIENKKI